jgi:hypothetical protein
MRLGPENPTVKKLERVFALMEELKIEISVNRYGLVTVTDREAMHVSKAGFDMMELEQGEAPPDFPPTFEYKLVFDDYREDLVQEVLES